MEMSMDADVDPPAHTWNKASMPHQHLPPLFLHESSNWFLLETPVAMTLSRDSRAKVLHELQSNSY
uniref:Uncharacterized protein n=1 Tax=Oryza meridionalis TaxID=40149 RepID=A0A0E0DWQ9_9ORYZ